MRIGSCSAISDWKNIAEIGYDYIETSFSNIARMTNEEFENAKALLAETGLKVEACNGFFYSKFVLYAYDPATGEATEEFENIKKEVYEYVNRGFSRVAQLGTKVVIIGSGTARNVPDDIKPEVARTQLKNVLKICGDVAAEYGIVVTVEPLNPSETNTINTLSDSLDLIDEMNHPNILAMNDFYHSIMQNEPLSTLDRAGKRLVHIHICRADRYSCTLADKDDLMPYVQHLADMGYDARLSFEGKSANDDRNQALRDTYELLKLFRDVKPAKS